MSLIHSRQVILPLSCALLFTLGNKGCYGLELPDGGMGPEQDAAPEDAGGEPGDDAGGAPDEDAGGEPQDRTCGGIAGLSCATTEFCNYESAAGGQGCDGSIADAAGVCEARPEFCTDEYAPVCGCDRRSYGNACIAHASGTAVLHRGRCTEIDCAAVGGHPVDGIGPGPMCPTGEVEYTWIGYSNGMIAIEGTACCVPE
jgi:hypothetical protein